MLVLTDEVEHQYSFDKILMNDFGLFFLIFIKFTEEFECKLLESINLYVSEGNGWSDL